MKKLDYILTGSIAFLLIIFSLIYYFIDRPIVYEVNFDSQNQDEKIQVKGLVKKYTLEPQENGTLLEIENYIMDKDEVEIQVKVPPNFKDYKNLVIEAEFENPDHPTLEVGVKKHVDYKDGEKVYDWEWQYLDNKYLNEYKKYLGKEWTVITDEKTGLSLFQKEKKYASVEAFLENPPKAKIIEETFINQYGIEEVREKEIPQIATVNYVMPQKYDIPELPEGTPNETVIPYSFYRGFYLNSYFSAEKKTIEIEFNKQDLNRSKGEDIYEFKIYDEYNELVFYKILNDDGVTDNSQEINIQKFSERINISKKGVYKISFAGSKSTDSMIRNIKINSFNTSIHDFHLVDDEFFAKGLETKDFIGYISNNENNYIELNSIARIQNVFLNNVLIEISKKNIKKINILKNINTIKTVQNNLVFRGSGIYFSEKAIYKIISPLLKKLYVSDISGINYVIASYKKNISKKLNTEKLYLGVDNAITIKLLAPSLSVYKNKILIKSIRVSLHD